MTGALGEFHIATDSSVEDAGIGPGHVGTARLIEEVAQVVDDFMGKLGLRIVQADNDAGDLQTRVDAPANESRGLQ